jgi:VanZ family protein
VGAVEAEVHHLQVLVAERTKWLLFALWCLLWILVVTKSLQPDLQLPLGLADKLVHFGTYALMAALVAGFCHVPGRIWFWAALAVVMGGLLELGQGFVPSRSLELGDFLANAAGAGCGALLAIFWITVVVRPLRPYIAR